MHTVDSVAILKKILQRPIAFHPVFAQISGSVNAGLFLSQLFYWQDKGSDEEGWIYKTYEEWKQETTMSRHELDGARKTLKSLFLIEEKKTGCPARLYYRINFESIVTILSSKQDCGKPADQFVENQQTRMLKTSKLDSGKLANNLYTENTSETTTKTTAIEPVLKALPPAIENGNGVSSKLEQFREIYNQHRPRFWPEMQVVNPKRQRLIKELIRDCGGTDSAIAALTNALKYAQGDSWYSSKTLNFENFASNGKILQLHERFIGQFDSGIPPALDTAANRQTFTEAERLRKILESKYGTN